MKECIKGIIRLRTIKIMGIIFFLIIICIANRYSLVAHISTKVYFNGADYNIFMWILAWDCHAIEGMKLKGFWSTNAMYPYPYVLAFSENLIGILPIAFPIWMLSHNPILTFNLTMHILMTLTVISSYIIFRRLVASEIAALMGAVCFSFYPYNLWSYTIGHPHMIGLMLLPVITYANLKYWREGRIKYLVIIVVLWLWNFLISIYIGILLLLFLGIWQIIWFIREKEIYSIGKIIKWCISIALVWIMMLPVFYIYYQVVNDMGGIRTLEHQERYTGYIWSWVVVPPDNFIWGRILKVLPSSRIMSAEDAMFPGVVMILMVIVSYFVKGMPAWLRSLRLGSVIIGILAMGPYAIGLPVKIPLPYGVVWYIFSPLRAIRNPHRLSLFVMLGFSFAVAYIINRLVKGYRNGLLVSVALLVLYCGETFTYFPSQEGLHPQAAARYRKLAVKEKPFVMIELPMPRRWSGWVLETKPMLNSTYHWNYIFNGISGLWPPAQYQVGRELKDFPSQHTVKLLQSLGINTVLINEGKYGKRLDRLLEEMNKVAQLHFKERIEGISIWYLDDGPKAVLFNPEKHLKLICQKDSAGNNINLLIEIHDELSEFIFNNKAPAKWKFPISELWKINIVGQNGEPLGEYEWDTPAIFHRKNNRREFNIPSSFIQEVRIRIYGKELTIKCS